MNENDTELAKLKVKVTVALICYQDAHVLGQALKSILSQSYKQLEIITLDAGTDERSLEIIKRAQVKHPEIRHFTVHEPHYSEMMNRALGLANGEYISFIFPNDRLLFPQSIESLIRLAEERDHPDLVYGGTYLQFPDRDPFVLVRELNPDLIKRGKLPALLGACLFKKQSLIDLGKFDNSFKYRGGLDIFARLTAQPHFRHAQTSKVIVEHNTRQQSSVDLIERAKETWRVVYLHFGILKAMRWWLLYNHFQFMRWWWRRLKISFTGRA